MRQLTTTLAFLLACSFFSGCGDAPSASEPTSGYATPAATEPEPDPDPTPDPAPTGSGPLAVGEVAEGFTGLPDTGSTVLVFYRGHW